MVIFLVFLLFFNFSSVIIRNESDGKRVMGKAEAKKIHKLNTILDSAFELFTKQGVEKTSISEISEKAGVAKGTFYLYFRDKHELRDRLIYHQSSKLFKEAAAALDNVIACSGVQMKFDDKMIFIIDYLINQLSQNPLLLSFISKNLSWGVFKKALTSKTTDDEIDFKQIYYKMLTEEDTKFNEPEIMLFMIIELVGSTCYSAVLYNEPAGIEELKPYLFNTIRAIIREHEITE